eukprot:2739642-Pyramimonas_sp.AAC.1
MRHDIFWQAVLLDRLRVETLAFPNREWHVRARLAVPRLAGLVLVEELPGVLPLRALSVLRVD